MTINEFFENYRFCNNDFIELQEINESIKKLFIDKEINNLADFYQKIWSLNYEVGYDGTTILTIYYKKNNDSGRQPLISTGFTSTHKAGILVHLGDSTNIRMAISLRKLEEFCYAYFNKFPGHRQLGTPDKYEKLVLQEEVQFEYNNIRIESIEVIKTEREKLLEQERKDKEEKARKEKELAKSLAKKEKEKAEKLAKQKEIKKAERAERKKQQEQEKSQQAYLSYLKKQDEERKQYIKDNPAIIDAIYSRYIKHLDDGMSMDCAYKTSFNEVFYFKEAIR